MPLQAMYATWSKAVPVTNSDSAGTNRYNALIVVTAGNLVVTPANPDGSAAANVTFTAIPCGAIIPFEVITVLATGSTAVVAGLV